MSPEQFKQIRLSLKLSQKELADKLELKTARAIRHYEKGTRRISGPIQICMRSLAELNN